MSKMDQALKSMADMKMWLNARSNKPLNMSDMPQLLSIRWLYFRDNWDFILPSLQALIPKTEQSDILKQQLEELTNLIVTQRSSATNINPFANSLVLQTYYSVWDNIAVASVPLTRQEEDLVNSEITRIRSLERSDFIIIRTNVIVYRDEIVDSINKNDSSYNTIYNRSSVQSTRDATIKDIAQLQNLQNAITVLDYILANWGKSVDTSVDPFALAKLNANNPDINIQSSTTGHLVKMFFGDSLEDLAYRHLGSSDRWIEIAIANGLKPPYIDEIGSTIRLISNGQKQQINIAATDIDGKSNREKIYINQIIFIQSDTLRSPNQKTITNIRQIPISGELVLELSGDSLDLYKTVDNANIRIFKPNTINSNFMVMIPDPGIANTQVSNKTPFFLSSKAEDEKRAGVDLALSIKNDLTFLPTSDVQLSYGLVNAMQAMMIKLSSEQGQNPRHNLFGLPNIIGEKSDNPNQLKQKLVSGITDMVNADSRFARLENLSVKIENNIAKLSISVRLAGSETVIPITFNVAIN